MNIAQNALNTVQQSFCTVKSLNKCIIYILSPLLLYKLVITDSKLIVSCLWPQLNHNLQTSPIVS